MCKNKADFVNNAETRRQYMSEISHLRQLRKEKRIQLLAMATTSNVLKSPRVSSKPTGKDFHFFHFFVVYIFIAFITFIFSLRTEKDEQRGNEGEVAQAVSSFERGATEATATGEARRSAT